LLVKITPDCRFLAEVPTKLLGKKELLFYGFFRFASTR